MNDIKAQIEEALERLKSGDTEGATIVLEDVLKRLESS